MTVYKVKPTTPGQRQAIRQRRDEITKKRPEKSLLKSSRIHAGRNNQGKITVRHRGGGHPHFYRQIDFLRKKYDEPAKVLGIEYDPNRSANIALIEYKDGEKSYILAPKDLKVGNEVISSQKKAPIEVANRLPMEHIPVGIGIYNIELEPGRGGAIVRSAGTTASLMAVEGKYAQIKLPSGEIRLIQKNSMATIGQVGNADYINVRLGKAGKKRWRGIRPTVRGKAMNPVDHPHGGGEGGSPIGMKGPKTPWGKKALGVITRKRKKRSNNMIIRRRK
ncbi:MAG: 50S ribosomal protein L2 [Patescibacteria group bacterium]